MNNNDNLGCSIGGLVFFWLFAGIFFVIAKVTDSVLLETLCIVFGIVVIGMGVSVVIEWLKNNLK